MDYKLRSKEKHNVVIDYQVSMDEFEPYLEKAYQKTKNKYALPGFRKGKVPRKLIELNYGKEVFYDDALNMYIPDAYDESVEKLELNPVAQPNFEMDSMDENGLAFHANVVVRPEVKLGQYKGFEIERANTEVSDEEIDHEIKHELDKNARIKTVEDRNAIKGDVVNIDFEGFIDEVPFDGGKGEGYDLELGSGAFIPGFEEQLEDAAIGEERDVKVNFPEEYVEELAGKEAVFKVKVNSISEKEYPEVDDEFAKDVSEFETLQEYKDSIRTRLSEEKQKQADNQLRNEAIEKAIENMEVEIPDEMVDAEIDHMILDFGRQLQMQGLDLKQYLEYTGMDEQNMRNSMKDEALNRVKGSLLFEAVIKEENIEISEDELNAEMERLAEEMKRDLEEIKKVYGSDDYHYLKETMKLRKASELVGQVK